MPPLRPSIIRRSRLHEKLDQGLSDHHKVIQISALAGSGKTTLITDWLASRSLSAAWFSIDHTDNDPVLFTTYLVSSLQRVNPEFGSHLLQSIETDLENGIDLKAWANRITIDLTNELSRIPQPCFLVFDDYHLIDNPIVHSIVSQMISNLPENAGVVICTRSDLPFSLSKYRARGQFTELRDQDLRFTEEESNDFMSMTMGISLSSDQVAKVSNEVEGWIAGLQLAALSLEHQEDIHEFLKIFPGSNEYILEYFIEEIFRHESDERIQFLLSTSILRRLTGSLCDAVTGNVDSQSILEDLDKSNFFVIALDNEKSWYRYHLVFADFLKNRLAEAKPQLVAELHRRASKWYQQHEGNEEAIYHLIAATDYELAAELIADEFWRMLQLGRQFTVKRWIETLPKSVRSKNPQMLLLYAWILLFTGDVNQYERPLNQAEQMWEKAGKQSHMGQIYTFRANVARLRRDPLPAIELANKALGALPPDSYLQRNICSMVLGDALLQVGKAQKAKEPLDTVLLNNHRSPNKLLFLIAKNRLADLAVAEGSLHEAQGYFEEVLAITGNQPLWQRVEALLGLAKIRLEWNQLLEAERCIDQAIEIGVQTNREAYLTDGYVTLAWLRLAQGDRKQTIKSFDEAVRLASKFEHQNSYRKVIAERARIRLLLGDQGSAKYWLETRSPDTDAHLGDYLYERDFITKAKIQLAMGEIGLANGIISILQTSANQEGRLGTVIELITLESLALWFVSKREGALEKLKEALFLAEPSGYVRMFAQEGSPMLEMLEHLISHSFMQEYTNKLIKACIKEKAIHSQQDHLVESLSRREKEVLILISQGASNKDIADRLSIAVSTTKKHVSNIIGKFGVKNRTEAVSRGKELGFL